MTIPIADHLWRRLPGEELLRLPPGHRAEYARTGRNELVVRITGPNAHVYGSAHVMNRAVEQAVEWFDQVGGEL